MAYMGITKPTNDETARKIKERVQRMLCSEPLAMEYRAFPYKLWEKYGFNGARDYLVMCLNDVCDQEIAAREGSY